MHTCASCGAPLPEGGACIDRFHLLLAWEWEYAVYDVHHLLVLCYYVQHPHLYSRAGLACALELLTAFVTDEAHPAVMRERIAPAAASGVRTTPITARPGDEGRFAHPVVWTMTARDVVENGPAAYYSSVHAWAASALASLRASHNTP
jgi:hypothetical protein